MYHKKKLLGKQRTEPAGPPPGDAVWTADSPIRWLKGVGPARMRLFEEAFGVRTLGDLLYLFPSRYEDRTQVKSIRDLTGTGKECVSGVVQSRGVTRTRGGRTLLRTVLSDGSGATLFGVWFNQPYLLSSFEPNSRLVFTGRAERVGRSFQMVHPEFEPQPDRAVDLVHSGRIVPVYPLTEDLYQKSVRQIFYRLTVSRMPVLEDPLPEELRARRDLPGLEYALRQIHFPESEPARQAAYRRLVFDEFFQMQVLIAGRRAESRSERRGLAHRGGQKVVEGLIGALPFELTADQRRCIEEILADLASDRPMHRLVQGDVGSGKTAVAAAALASTAANGFQGALMAPTEILAQQQFYGLSQMLEPLGYRCDYLCAGRPASEQQRALEDLAAGRTSVIVGTHALLSGSVRFRNLGLVVIDEQHKFGVEQRGVLRSKGVERSPHLLLLSATPIPRTLAMTLYGEMDLSVIASRPSGRKSVRTVCVSAQHRHRILECLRAVLAEGRQAYVVCPAISSESAAAGLRDARAVAVELKSLLPDRRIGLLHGRLSAAEKRSVMADFKQHRIDVLVSTVVVEVGIDVPNAALMIIENADRFGLAQLHQLRGRIGRGEHESLCVAVADDLAGESAARLEVFERHDSGFDIAEKDLGLRGAGDVVRTAQHGVVRLRIGDLSADAELLAHARIEADALLQKDPKLRRIEHHALRRQLEKRFGWGRAATERTA